MTERQCTVAFYRGDRKIDEWLTCGESADLLAKHNRIYPMLAADRVEVVDLPVSKVEAD